MANLLLKIRLRLNSLNNLAFLICLFLLLLNDFYLKYEFHNWFTGKLSDFCGLFVFVLFWNALFPTKKQIVYLITAILFVLWKSPYSQDFILFFSQNFYTISRVIDFSDLIALCVLPIAYLYSERKHLIVKFVQPTILGVITIFSFCSTSQSFPIQSFEQPQYILLNYLDTGKVCYYNDFKFYNIDSLLLVEVKAIGINAYPKIDDEYQKVKILQNLDIFVIKELKIGNCYNSLYNKNLINIKDSFLVNNKTVELKQNGYIDYLQFKNSRLNGDFKRYSKSNQLLIEGKYLNGIEDSVWVYYENNEVILKKYFIEGEKIKEQKFEKSKLINELEFQTRKSVINLKYFKIVLLSLTIIFLLIKLINGFKKRSNHLKYTHWSKVGFSILASFIVSLISRVLLLIPNSYNSGFPSFIFEIAFFYVLVFILFLFIFYLVKIRTKYDILIYVLLFSFGIFLFLEVSYLFTLLYDLPDTTIYRAYY